MEKFKLGQRVRLVADPKCKGEITYIHKIGDMGVNYEVEFPHGVKVLDDYDIEPCSYIYKIDLNDVKFKAAPETRSFESGAVRDKNTNKAFIHCLLGYTRQRFGYHMSKNASKYGEFNFLKGIPTAVYLESIDRHLAAYMENDRSEDHLAAILFGIQGCMLNEQKDGVIASTYFNALV